MHFFFLKRGFHTAICSIYMNCCQYIFSLSFCSLSLSLSLSRHACVIYLCLRVCHVGLIIYFTLVLSVHCTPGTYSHVDEPPLPMSHPIKVEKINTSMWFPFLDANLNNFNTMGFVFLLLISSFCVHVSVRLCWWRRVTLSKRRGSCDVGTNIMKFTTNAPQKYKWNGWNTT